MKKLLLMMFLFLSVSFSMTVNAWFFSDLAKDSKAVAPYCSWDWDCSLDKWMEMTKWWMNDMEKDKTASTYIQDMVAYALKFISMVAVMYVMYAWFGLLTSAWDEEKAKKTKTMMMYVMIWMVIMWLASPMLTWIMNLLNQSS